MLLFETTQLGFGEARLEIVVVGLRPKEVEGRISSFQPIQFVNDLLKAKLDGYWAPPFC